MNKLFPLLSFIIILVACQSGTESGSAQSNEGTTSAKAETTAQGSSDAQTLFDHEGFTTKYNQYIAFQNEFHEKINSTAEIYYREYNPEQALSQDNRPIIWSHTISDLSYFIEQAKAEPKITEVDQMAMQLYPKAKALDSLLKLSSFYYSKEVFKEDNFKEGNVLSTQVESAMNAYLKSYDNFQAAMARLLEDLDAHELKVLKEQGLEVRYNLLSAVNEADKLVGYIYIQSELEFKDVDHDHLNQLISNFNKPIESLEKMAVDEERLKEELGFRYSYMNTFLMSSAGLIRNSKALQERIKNNDWEYSVTHPNIADKGSVEKITEEYSSIINAYNSM